MDEFYSKPNQKKIKSWLMKIDLEAGTQLETRYQEWLKIMDAVYGGVTTPGRRTVPAGISDCISYLVKKNDIDKWVAAEELFVPRPDYRMYRKKAPLAEYNCGLSYYFRHKSEVKSRIRQIRLILDTPPEDRFAPTRDPYEGAPTPFSPENQTAKMVEDAMLNENAKRLQHKVYLYDGIIAMIAIKTLGLEAEPVIDKAIFEQYREDLDPEVEKMVEYALKQLEMEWCKKHKVKWTDEKPDPTRPVIT